MSNRRIQLRVAAATGLTAQDEFGVPLDLGDIDFVFTPREGTQTHIEPIFISEDLNDCTTQYLKDLIILHRYARLTMDLEVNKDILAAIVGKAFGIESGSSRLMLGPTVVILPSTTFVVGFADDEDPGILFYDAVCESLEITGEIDQKMQVRVTWVGRGDMLAAEAFTFPDCEDITPLRFDQNASIIIDGEEQILKARRLVFTYNNNIPLRDHPFALGVIDISRPFERGDKRVYTTNVLLEGRIGDDLAAMAITIPPTHVDFSFRIGDPGIVFSALDAMIRPNATTLQEFHGEVSLGVLSLLMTPTRVSGEISTPFSAEVD